MTTTTGRAPFATVPPLETPTGNPASVPEGHWQAILADLTARGIPTDDVAVLEAMAVTWSDGSLGCPQPGSAYTQALVDGMKVVVRVDGTAYEYHFGGDRSPVLCVRGRPA